MTKGQARRAARDEVKSAPAVEKPSINLDAIVHECLEQSDFSLTRASDLLAERIIQDDALLEHIVAEHLPEIASGLVRKVNGRIRHVTWRKKFIPPEEKAQKTAESISLYAKYTLLDFVVPNQGPLRRLTKTGVLEGAKYYGELKDQNGQREKWLLLIANNMPDAGVVEQVMTEQRLHELQQQAQS